MTKTVDWSSYASALQSNGLSWDLFTVLDVDWENSLVRRSFSSDEANYGNSFKRAMSAFSSASAWPDEVV